MTNFPDDAEAPVSAPSVPPRAVPASASSIATPVGRPSSPAHRAPSRFECTTRHRVARYNADLKEFELQCPHCRSKSRQSYWPLTLEFWNPHSLSICRACHAERDRAKQRERRQDEAKRLADIEKSRAWRERNPGYATETTRAWRAANPERDRANNRAGYLRRKAAA